MIHGNAVEPGEHLLVQAEAVQGPVCAQEYLLRRLLRFLAVSKERKGEPHDEALVPVNDEPKGVLVPSKDLADCGELVRAFGPLGANLFHGT